MRLQPQADRFSRLLLLFFLLLGALLGGCSLSTLNAPGLVQPYPLEPSGSTVVSAAPYPPPLDETTTPGFEIPTGWQRVEIPEAGIQLERPEGWLQDGEAWAWSPDLEGPVRLVITWKDEVSGDAEVFFLPNRSEIIQSTQMEIAGVPVRSIAVRIYQGATRGENFEGVELHMIFRGPGSRTYDFYAASRTEEDLAALQAILEHAIESVSPLG